MNKRILFLCSGVMVAGSLTSVIQAKDFFSDMRKQMNQMQEEFDSMFDSMQKSFNERFAGSDTKSRDESLLQFDHTDDGLTVTYGVNLGKNRKVSIDDQEKKITIFSDETPRMTVQLSGNKQVMVTTLQESKQEKKSDEGSSYSYSSAQSSQLFTADKAVRLPGLDDVTYNDSGDEHRIKILLPYKRSKEKVL